MKIVLFLSSPVFTSYLPDSFDYILKFIYCEYKCIISIDNPQLMNMLIGIIKITMQYFRKHGFVMEYRIALRERMRQIVLWRVTLSCSLHVQWMIVCQVLVYCPVIQPEPHHLVLHANTSVMARTTVQEEKVIYDSELIYKDNL